MPMDTIKKLLQNNKKWADYCVSQDPSMFENLSQGQAPSLAMITCVDSRVAPETILGMDLGEALVYRNVANQAHQESVEAFVYFAVNAMKVKGIVVCGHTQCGGVKYAISNPLENQPLDRYLEPLSQYYTKDCQHLHSLEAGQQAFEFSKLNVLKQVKILENFDCIKQAHQNACAPVILPFLFHLETGLVEDLSETV